MSNRSHGHHYDKGSSRSTRDDSRRTAAERERYAEGSGRLPAKSRSRSPRRRHCPEESKSRRYSPGKRRNVDDHVQARSSSQHERDSSDEEVPAPPPPPRITKISIGFSKPKVAPIKMNIGGAAKTSAVVPKPTVASVFNNDDDDEDEPEEMPAEARMRMRNIGRETPTSAGPNSFGKTKQGFCDAKKVFEKNLKQALDADRPSMPKFPQTIYKIKGP